MKIFGLLICVFFLSVNTVSAASEIFGRISTDPRAVQGTPASETPAPGGGGGGNYPGSASPLASVSRPVKVAPSPDNDKPDPEKTEEVKVLGARHFPDGSLLRGPDKRIYRIEGQVKKYIANLDELKKYRGQKIFNVTADELKEFEAREHLNGELIREIGTLRVYVIKEGRRRHILNLEELRAHYFGLEIHNIRREEMGKYEQPSPGAVMR